MQRALSGKRSRALFGRHHMRARKPTTALLAAVLCLGLSSCGDDEGPPRDTAKSVSDTIQQGASEWLGGFRSSEALECTQNTNIAMLASDSLVRACAFSDGDNNSVLVKIQNDSTVPISIWGRPNIDPVYTVLPHQILEMRLYNPEWGQFLSYKADTRAGLTAVVVDQALSEIKTRTRPGYNWADCGFQPNADCLLDGLVAILPKEVTIGGRKIPTRTLAEGLSLAFQEQDLLKAFEGELVNEGSSTLTITRL